MDDAQTRMLQTLSQDPGAARTMVQNMLAERAAADPTMAVLMQMMASGEEAPAPRPQGGTDPDRAARAQRLRQRIRQMRDELEELHQRNEDLAAAVGACPVCWGRVETCEECEGDGAPGWDRPDPALFDELVAPAVARRRDGRAKDLTTGRKL